MRNLKDHIGYIIVCSTVIYCLIITAALLWGCTFSEIVKDLILIILTWFISKSGTIVDYFYSSSEPLEPTEPPKN